MTSAITPNRLSFVLPARNERENLQRLLPSLIARFPGAEIIVVDDGSTDGSRDWLTQQPVSTVHHPYSKGNGAAVKSGARAATREIMVLMDADGQHRPEDVALLLARYAEGYDMMVGSRSRAGQATLGRWVANSIYNRLSSWMVNHRIQDLTSGLRVVRLDRFREFLPLLPNGFSYPTTITMAFFRAGYSVGYQAVNVQERLGTSHVRPLRDGVRFFLVIFRVGTLYSPLKIFAPISLGFFLLGAGYYLYTFLATGRFTNMSALLITTSVIIGLIGLVSEQITSLLYAHQDSDPSKRD